MKTEYESAFSVPRSSIVMGSSMSPLPCFQKLKRLLLTCFTCFKNWKNAAYRCTCLHALENCCLHALKIWTPSTISAPVHQEVKLRKETESAKIRKKFRKAKNPRAGAKPGFQLLPPGGRAGSKEMATEAKPEANRRTLSSKTTGIIFEIVRIKR